MNRGELLSQLQAVENNYSIVYRAMQEYYHGDGSLEDALMIAVVRLAAANHELGKAAMWAPPPQVIIVKPKES